MREARPLDDNNPAPRLSGYTIYSLCHSDAATIRLARQSSKNTPASTPPIVRVTHRSPDPSHCRMGRAAPVLLAVAPLVLDPRPAVTVPVA